MFMMASNKRSRIELDPDYEDVTEEQCKRQRVIEKDAKDATLSKIEGIIRKEFSSEICNKEEEIEAIDERLHQTRIILDRLRACVVATFYGNAGQVDLGQIPASKIIPIHPTVKNHLGKAPKGHVSTENVDATVKVDLKETKLDHDIQLQVKEEPKANSSEEVAGRHARFKVKKRIIVGNVSKYIPVDHREENDQPTHKWMVYVRGPAHAPRIDNFVKKVLFLLHPSYKPNDLVEVSQPPFHLTRRGWGEFPIRVQLHFKDQRNKKLDIIHPLKLDRTYTGLQTLGSETVVDIELERDLSIEPTKLGILHMRPKKEKSISSSFGVNEECNVTIKEERSPDKFEKKPSLDENSLLAQTLLHGTVPTAQSPSSSSVGSNKENAEKHNIKVKTEPRSNQNLTGILKPGAVGTIPLVISQTGTGLQLGTQSGNMLLKNVILNTGDKKLTGSISQNIGISLIPPTQNAKIPTSQGTNPPQTVQVVLGNVGSINTTNTVNMLENKASPQRALAQNKGTVKSLLQGAGVARTVAETKSKQTILLQGGLKMSTPALLSGKSEPGVVNSPKMQVISAPSTVNKQISGTSQKTNPKSGSTSCTITSPQVMGPSTASSSSAGIAMASPSTSAQTLYVRCKDSQGNIFLVPHHLLKQVANNPVKANSLATTKPTEVPSMTTTTTPSLTQSMQNVHVSFAQNVQKTVGATSSQVPKASVVQHLINPSVTLSIGVPTTAADIVPNKHPVLTSVVPQTLSASKSGNFASLLKTQNVLAKPGVSLLKPEIIQSCSSIQSVTDRKPIVKEPQKISLLHKGEMPKEKMSTAATINVSCAISNTKTTQTAPQIVSSPITIKSNIQNIPQSVKLVNQSKVSAQSCKSTFISTNHSVSSVPVVDKTISQNQSVSGQLLDGKKGLIVINGEIPKQVQSSGVDDNSSVNKPSISTLAPTQRGMKQVDINTATGFVTGNTDKKMKSLLNGNKFSAHVKSEANNQVLTNISASSEQTSHSLGNDHKNSSTIVANLGGQKVIVQMPGNDGDKCETEVGSRLSSGRNSPIEKHVFNYKKKKMYESMLVETKKIVPIKPLPRLANKYEMSSLVKAAVIRHPIISPDAVKQQHPYCAESTEQWLSWNIGRRRASEWQRASAVRKFLKCFLGGEEQNGISLWTVKQIMIWCRTHALSPHYLEKTLHPSQMELSADTNMLGKQYSSVTDSASLLSWIHQLKLDEDDSDDDIDIISIELPKVKIKKEIIEESIPCDEPIYLESSKESKFVEDTATKIGVKFSPVEVLEDVSGSVSQDMVFAAFMSFASDILREAFSDKINMGRYADGIGVGDLYKTMRKMPLCDFLLNGNLGVPKQKDRSQER